LVINISDLTLRDLEYILAVARYSSFSQAAEACAVSQPALSKQVKSVESTLGVQLFERSKRKVLLTECGQVFVRQAQVVIDEAQKLLHVTCRERHPLSGTFRLGVIASSCPYLLPHFVGSLREAFPQLKLVIKEGLTDSLVQELKQGNLDAVIAATTFEDEALAHRPLFFEPFLLAVGNGSRVKRKVKVTIDDVNTEELLLLEDGHCLKDQTVALCSLQGHPGLNFKATSLETLLQMTAGGLGISIIPALAAPETSKFGANIAFSGFADSEIGRVMAMYYRKTYPLTEDILALCRFIRAHLPDTVVLAE
jgi:LysR family transcriptional regulator, hydrogen peroxide-inducible genes activator